MENPPPPPPAKWTPGALIIFVIGLLILVPSGLCTGIFGFLALLSSAPGDFSDAMADALTFGGPFILLGGGLVFLALQIKKRNAKP